MSNRQTYTFQESLTTESGFSIADPTVSYQTWGELNDDRDNAIIVFHALTGDTSVDQWFSEFFGSGKIFDPERHFIICANALGSCYGSSGPTSINPTTGEAYRADFPKVTIRDMVRLHQRLLDKLKISGVELAIGGSMGGMQALEFCIMDNRPQAAVLMGMGVKHAPWAIGISHTQRQAIYSDPNWNEGYYTNDDQPTQGLALARMIAMNSYRHPRNFEQKFGRKLQDKRQKYQVESYLNYQGQKLVDRFDAVSYVRLTQAMDSHDIARNRSGYEDVLADISIPTLVIGIDSDMLYPVHEQHELAQLLPNGRYQQLKSVYGHDAFLIEFEKLNRLIKPFLTETSNSLTVSA